MLSKNAELTLVAFDFQAIDQNYDANNTSQSVHFSQTEWIFSDVHSSDKGRHGIDGQKKEYTVVTKFIKISLLVA